MASGGSRSGIAGDWLQPNDISFDENKAELRFLRPGARQRYVGTLDDQGLNGTFELAYLWKARRVGGMPKGNGDTDESGATEPDNSTVMPFYQIDFNQTYNHGRPVKPYLVDDIPVSGYNNGTAPMVCLSKGQTPFNDGIDYPESYQWTVPSVQSSEIWITSNLFWWGSHFAGNPIARITVSGDQGTRTYDVIGNRHTGEWNQSYIQPAEGTTIHDGVRNITGAESRFHVARFSFESMIVNNISIELLTAAPWGSKFGVFAIYSVTLVNPKGDR